MSRIFLAVNLPPTIKDELAQAQKEINSALPLEAQGKGGAVKWVEKDNLHITLLFIGEVKTELLPKICQVIEQAIVKWQSFEIKLEKVCYDIIEEQTSRGLAPRLVWAKLAKSKDLECLNKAVKDKLLDEGILRYVDKRPFQGHITLGRVRAWQWKKISLDERPEIDCQLDLDFAVKSIDIMESRLHKAGPEYNILKSIKLF